MITFKKFGDHGRLGNQLFQYAALIGFQEKYRCEMVLPPWEYSAYFANPPKMVQEIQTEIELREPHFHYTPEFWSQHADSFRSKNVDILGWLQTEKYWDHCVAKVKKALAFRDHITSTLKQKYKDVFTKPVIAISVRRGDYVDNPNYDLLPINYYLLALYEHFPNLEDFNIIVFSDDLVYAKHNFSGLANAYFPECENAISQLCLMSLCDHFIIANSTFSWWGAYLGEKKYSKVIRPNYVFAGELLKNSSWKDHYPARWTVYDHKDAEGNFKKFDLTDVTFTIPVFYDHPDRLENLTLNIKKLQLFFNTNFIIGEHQHNAFVNKFPEARYFRFREGGMFHRTKMLNMMAKMVDTKILVNWDADVFLPPVQILETARMIRSGKADMVYPYDGRFARVPRSDFKFIDIDHDMALLAHRTYKGTSPSDPLSVGGAVFWNKKKFFEAGMENEYMVSYAPEDLERYERATRLGYKVKRIRGVIFHLDHWVGANSSGHHPYFTGNWNELYKIRVMTDDQLKQYVGKWSWVKGDHYTPPPVDVPAQPAVVGTQRQVVQPTFGYGKLNIRGKFKR